MVTLLSKSIIKSLMVRKYYFFFLFFFKYQCYTVNSGYINQHNKACTHSEVGKKEFLLKHFTG